MVTPLNDAALLAAWRRYRDQRLGQEDTTLEQVCRELKERYGCDSSTVRRHLDPSYAARQRTSHREAESRRYARRKARREKSRRRRAERPDWVRRYERNYRRLHLHPDRYLSHAFPQGQPLPLDAITAKIHELCENVPFRPKTIERILRDYELKQKAGRIRGPPWLYEDPPHSGYWRYSSDPPSRAPPGVADDDYDEG